MTTDGEEPPPPPPDAPPPIAAGQQSWSEDNGDDEDSTSSSEARDVAQQEMLPPSTRGRLGSRPYDSPYVSSASSASSSQAHPKAFFPPEGTPTIRHSKSSSDDFCIPQPTHQFPAFYDSDGSDGSLVFSYPRGTTPPATYDLPQSMMSRSAGVSPSVTQQIHHHDRWGSMDSSGSRESPRPLQQHKRANPPPQQHGRVSASPQNVYNNYNPQVLPYHQRRKLLQKRQQQQEQHQEPPSDPVFAFQQQEQQPPRRNSRNNSLSQKTPPPSDGNSTPNYQSRRPVPLDTISATAHHPPTLTPKTFPHSHAPQIPIHPPPAPPPPLSSHHYSLPPSGHSRSFSGSGSFVVQNRARVSSMDSQTSTDSYENTTRPRRRSEPHGPPPPPPPPPPYSHIRADSSGSVSSLGSSSDPPLAAASLSSRGGGSMSLTDRLDKDIMGFLQEEKHHGHMLPPPPPPQPPQQQQRVDSHEHRRSSGGSGFLLGLFNMSPKSQHRKDTKPNVEEYHQRNQAFLQRAERERAKLQMRFHPQPPPRRGSTSPRPPNTRGVHRPGLSSIDNDNWEEDEESDKRNKGRSFKQPAHRHASEFQEDYEDAKLPPHNRAKDRGRDQDAARAAAILAEDQYRCMSNSNHDTSFISSSQDDDDETDDEATSSGRERLSSSNFESDEPKPNEETSLLPPSGISTQEGKSKAHSYVTKGGQGGTSSRSSRLSNYSANNRSARDWNREETIRWDNRQAATMARKSKRRGKHRRKKGRKEKHRSRRHYHHRQLSPDESDEVSEDLSFISSSSSSSEYDNKRWAKKRAKMFEKERTKLIAQWKAEAKAEAEAARKIAEANRWHKRLGRWLEGETTTLMDRILKSLATAETFICNLPLTIGAVALAIVTLGVVWFKFAEENLESCEPVHFHSSQCTFPEFPGCFYCDTHTRLYKFAVNFHFCCSVLAGILAMGFVAKVVLAFRVVLDEMSSPTTSSPAGLICMTTVCVFAGRGWVGQILVSAAATLHLGLVIWFIYMALAYHIMPEPSWFPNTVGIGLSAVKTWLYYPMPGHFLMAISLSLNFFFFPISLIRVFLNEKMSAPVCWIQMSAPAISLYALTIMAQPSFEEEHPDVTRFQRVHRMVYLPCMHILFFLAVLGLLSSVQSLATRWEKFKGKEFSPAHAAFCFPTLAHANAIQAYRAAVDAFSPIAPGSPLKIALYSYWVLVLAGGTGATLYITSKFFYHLPSWTQVDVADEEEPPAPNETTLRDVIATGETLRQPFVSPAVLQANETGALIFLRRGEEDGRGRYVRTRRLPALGFEPTMNWSEMNAERDVLLEWVAKNPPRRRKKTLSVPGVDFNYGFGDFGTGNSGVYGLEGGGHHGRAFSHIPTRERSNTFDMPGGGFY